VGVCEKVGKVCGCEREPPSPSTSFHPVPSSHSLPCLESMLAAIVPHPHPSSHSSTDTVVILAGCCAPPSHSHTLTHFHPPWCDSPTVQSGGGLQKSLFGLPSGMDVGEIVWARTAKNAVSPALSPSSFLLCSCLWGVSVVVGAKATI
jgi:hypothetical protein